MLRTVVVIVGYTQTVDIAGESAEAFAEHLRHVFTAEAAALHHLFQLQVRVEVGRLCVDEFLYLCGYSAGALFDEFVQLDEYYDGTGIGLTVARSLVRSIGGDIILDTAYIGGSRFVMTLPIS